MVIGAGGLGCPVLQYLTAAGVGTIGIVDGDVVEKSNLQRQILYTTEDVGTSKVKAAIKHLELQNPHVAFIAHEERLTTDNALDIIKGYDMVLDGTDNFPTRYLVNDACTILDKPLVFGSIYKFSGQVSVFNYHGGPSYRCLYPQPPQEGEVPNCSEIGVIGVLPGIVGTLMASECIKMILQLGDVLNGKLLLVDTLGNQYMSLQVTRNEENFTRQELEKDYLEVCGIKKVVLDAEMNAQEIYQLMEDGQSFHFLDVREPYEFDICQIENSQLIPLGEVPHRSDEIIQNGRPTVVVCHHGIRSARAIQYLESQGFRNLINLRGGIHAWAVEVEENMARY